MIRAFSLLSLAFLVISPAGAQPRVQTDFTAQDFQVRRTRIYDVIGDNLAVIQGAEDVQGFYCLSSKQHFLLLEWTGGCECLNAAGRQGQDDSALSAR